MDWFVINAKIPPPKRTRVPLAAGFIIHFKDNRQLLPSLAFAD